MGWSTSKPSGYTWNDTLVWGSPRNEDNNWYWFQTVSKIGRGSGNNIALEIRLQVYGHNYDRRTSYPSVDINLAAQVKVSSGSWATSSDYACNGNYQTWNNAQTVYWTGTADKDLNVYVRAVWSSSHYSGEAVHKAPSYTTQYTITYNANGGSGTMSQSVFIYGGSTTVKANEFTAPSNKHFTTWYDKNGVEYPVGSTYSKAAHLGLYAQWAYNTYTISYNANGGSGAPSSQTKTHGTDLTLRTGVPTRSGYTFLGWATSSSATTAQYQPGGTFTTNANTTLYAVWQKDITNKQIYVAVGGQVKQVEKVYVAVGGQVKEVTNVYIATGGQVKEVT